jgi:4-carboxymuconolactone decarboxylase
LIGRDWRPSGQYQFCKEIHDRKGEIADATYQAVADRFGERGVMDLIALTGNYTMLAMVLNVTRQPLPDGAAPLLRALK